jgi:predicted DNA-binding transcriptional regulator AlpA
MSAFAPVIERPYGGRARAAVSFGNGWTYCRAIDRRNSSRRTDLMLPDPATRPVLTAEEAFAELGIDRSTGYKSIRDGTFPVPIIRVGRIIRVPTAALRRLLLVDPEAPADRSEAS